MNHASPAKSGQQKRFVILRHHFPDGGRGEFSDHYDLMLEQDSKLATWRIDAIPKPNQTVRATRLADHRKAYLDYQGPISGDRGTVEQFSTGTYEICDQHDSYLEVLMMSGDEPMRLKIVSGRDKSATVLRIAAVG